MRKGINKLFIRVSILQEFFKTLWKFKLWWALPIIFILVFLIIFLVVAGHTGVAAFIYPLF